MYNRTANITYFRLIYGSIHVKKNLKIVTTTLLVTLIYWMNDSYFLVLEIVICANQALEKETN